MKKTKIKKPKNGFKGQKSKDIEWNDSHTSQQNSGLNFQLQQSQ